MTQFEFKLTEAGVFWLSYALALAAALYTVL